MLCCDGVPDVSNADVSGFGRCNFRAVGRCVVTLLLLDDKFELLSVVLFTLAVDAVEKIDDDEFADVFIPTPIIVVPSFIDERCRSKSELLLGNMGDAA